MRNVRASLIAIAVSLVLVSQMAFACVGGAKNFAQDLRLALAVSGPLIESLNLGGKKAALVADFTDLGSGAASLADAINACNGAKPCELSAVQAFESTFELVLSRGNFGLSSKLGKIEGILRGIIAAAKIYYSPAALRTARRSARDQGVLIKSKIEELKVAMRP